MLTACLKFQGPIAHLGFVSLPQASPRTLLIHGSNLPSAFSLSHETQVSIPHPTPQDPPSLLSLGRPPKIVRIGPTLSGHGPKFLNIEVHIEGHTEGHRDPACAEGYAADASWPTQTQTQASSPGCLAPLDTDIQMRLERGLRQTPSAVRRPEFKSPHLFSLKPSVLSGPYFIICNMGTDWVISKTF